jgi:hypothetical protein
MDRLCIQATTVGGYSAICLLTAQKLWEATNGSVPIGAVESAVSGTSVERWMPTGTPGWNPPCKNTHEPPGCISELWEASVDLRPLLCFSVFSVNVRALSFHKRGVLADIPSPWLSTCTRLPSILFFDLSSFIKWAGVLSPTNMCTGQHGATAANDVCIGTVGPRRGW